MSPVTVITRHLMKYVIFAWIVLLAHMSFAQDDCLGMDQCSCQYSDGSMVALHSLGNNDGTPRYKDVPASDGYTYSFNPCYPFDEGDGCSEAAACSTNTVGQSETIGAQQSAQFSGSGNQLEVDYTAGSGILTQTAVILKCDKTACSPTFTAAGGIGPNSYQFTLETVCACAGGCTEDGPVDCTPSGGSAGIGGGAVFLIVFLSLFAVYFFGGMVFMKFGRKATGKEIIPNVGFWTKVPSYVKAGTLFVLKPCLKKSGKYDSV